MKTVLITGAAGQLGKCIQEAAPEGNEIDWLFMDSSEVDITSLVQLQELFNRTSIDICINCAAYTNVEKAESDQERAYLINAEAVKNLAEVCRENDAVLYHFSTDYVFKGDLSVPYKESDPTSPINVYGASKLRGEDYIRETAGKYFIFRTSWLYSRFGHNFYKTILQRSQEGAVLNITTSQRGTPTNAHHLARFIVMLISTDDSNYGTYHYSNTGETTWYGFAREILKVSGRTKSTVLNEDNSYKTIAPRPPYSVLDKSGLIQSFQVSLSSWEQGVEDLYQIDSNNL